MPAVKNPFPFFALPCAVALGYVLLAAAASAMRVEEGHTVASLPAGFALAMLLLGGERLWPAVLAGAGLAALAGPVDLPLDVAVALATTVQVVVAARLCRRLGLRRRLDRMRDVVVLAGAGGAAASALGASLAAVAVWIVHGSSPETLALTWLGWWMGSFVGVIVVAPVVLLAGAFPRRISAPSADPATLAVLLVLTVSAGMMVSGIARPYMVFPALLLAALRFRVTGAALASLVVAVLAGWGATHGFGPFGAVADASSAIHVQTFVCTVTLTALMLGALTAERIEAQERLLDSEAERLVMVVEREAEQRFRRSFDDAPIGMALMGFSGHLLRINHMLAEITGFAEHELVGRTLEDLTHPDDAEAEMHQVGPLLSGDARSFETEKRLVRSDGQVAWVLISGSLVRDDNGRPAYLITQLMDITERRRVERELAISTEELRRSNQELERFAYIASHDLCEPLRTMAGFATLLRERYAAVLDDRGLRYADHVVTGAKRMQELIDGLLEYSRAGRQDLAVEPVDCLRLAEQVVAELCSRVQDRDASVRIGPLPTVVGDPVLLRQVFQNLIANALKFTGGRRPEVVISADWDSTACRISVHDNGIGIDPRHGERIFEMFQRLHTRDQYEGTGIGLALVKRIVELHGGEVTVESVPRAGTTFSFTLAVAPADVAARPLALRA